MSKGFGKSVKKRIPTTEQIKQWEMARMVTSRLIVGYPPNIIPGVEIFTVGSVNTFIPDTPEEWSFLDIDYDKEMDMFEKYLINGGKGVNFLKIKYNNSFQNFAFGLGREVVKRGENIANYGIFIKILATNKAIHIFVITDWEYKEINKQTFELASTLNWVKFVKDAKTSLKDINGYYILTSFNDDEFKIDSYPGGLTYFNDVKNRHVLEAIYRCS